MGGAVKGGTVQWPRWQVSLVTVYVHLVPKSCEGRNKPVFLATPRLVRTKAGGHPRKEWILRRLTHPNILHKSNEQASFQGQDPSTVSQRPSWNGPIVFLKKT